MYSTVHCNLNVLHVLTVERVILIFFFLLQINKEPQGSSSWYDLGQIAGIDIVEDEEVDEEVAQTEEDREVENIIKTNREKHNKLQKGTVHVNCMS